MDFYDYIKIDEKFGFYFVWSGENIIRTSFSEKIVKDIKRRENKKVKGEFENYFFYKKPLKKIKYKFFLKLTDFEKQVLAETFKIPFGKTLTYKGIAERIGKPKSYRAVGNALGKNPLPVIIPCHRVLSKTGLGGFTGGLNIKKYLLKIEGVI
jgi:methylated-DNA-[protein]-cysteine S-methyltransferase